VWSNIVIASWTSCCLISSVYGTALIMRIRRFSVTKDEFVNKIAMQNRRNRNDD